MLRTGWLRLNVKSVNGLGPVACAATPAHVKRPVITPKQVVNVLSFENRMVCTYSGQVKWAADEYASITDLQMVSNYADHG